MPIEYARNQELVDAVMALISEPAYTEFQSIRDQELLFQVAAMVKTDAEGQTLPTTGEAVIVRRIGPADAVFLDGHFKVYVCQVRWNEANEIQQKAMLHRALMRVSIEQKDSGIKIGFRKPDVSTFQQTIIRFGAWENELITLRNNLEAAQKRSKKLASEAVNAA